MKVLYVHFKVVVHPTSHLINMGNLETFRWVINTYAPSPHSHPHPHNSILLLHPKNEKLLKVDLSILGKCFKMISAHMESRTVDFVTFWDSARDF